MLQPVQLQEVSQQFASEIASLRNFLSQAGVPVGTMQSVHDVVTRTAADRAFHRDLTSHIWVLLDEHESKLRYPTLMGIVVIAAAGLGNASGTDEEDAHALLRFLMEAKHSFDGVSPSRKSAEMPKAAANPTPLSEAHKQASAVVEVQTSERRIMPQRSADPVREAGQESQELRESRPQAKPRRFVLPAIVVFGVAALILVCFVVLHRPHAAAPGDVTVASERGSADGTDKATRTGSVGQRNSASNGSEQPPSRTTVEHPRSAGAFSSLARVFRFSGRSSAEPPTRTDSAAPIVRVPAEQPVASAAPSVSRSIDPGVASNPAALVPLRTPSLVEKSTGPGKVMVVPADVLSRQLDSPRLPSYASDADESGVKKYPRLLRRHTSDTRTEEGSDPQLSAALRAPDLTNAGTRAASSPPLGGLVRSTCLGMMAGNLIYSPAPSYPVAAASARVQGEVKIQATVDRDGTINSARVISGPPSLRDAALDAVEHWRFKPFVSGGKATPTGATAVVDFELQ